MYVQRNNEARLRNHYCSGKAISITYLCVCVRARARACVWEHGHWRACERVALLIQHATLHHIVICGFSSFTIFFDIISYMAQFSEKVTGHKMCILIFCTIFI